MKLFALAAVLLLPGTLRAAPYTLRDSGDFQPSGHRVEFADRYGWRGYEMKFEFGLEPGGRRLTKDSRLSLRITRRSGGDWEYACRARGRKALSSNINFLHGKGVSVVVECAVDQDDFADAVNLGKEDVGLPHLVFHAMVLDGKVTLGAQRGLYIIPSGQFEASELNAYASVNDDPSNLSVVFRSN